MLAREEPRWVGSSTIVGGPDQDFFGLSCCPAGSWGDRGKYFSALNPYASSFAYARILIDIDMNTTISMTNKKQPSHQAIHT
jgi:hypothetical protein